jgi:hypothetical protein
MLPTITQITVNKSALKTVHQQDWKYIQYFTRENQVF